MSTIPVEHSWQATQWDWPLQHHDGVVQVTDTKDKFEVGLEVQYFTPNEVEVKVVGNELIVHCRHEERSDKHGRISREIHRTYHLPADVDPKSLKSTLTAKGVLTITAAKKK